jgi:hypothetical protein
LVKNGVRLRPEKPEGYCNNPEEEYEDLNGRNGIEREDVFMRKWESKLDNA